MAAAHKLEFVGHATRRVSSVLQTLLPPLPIPLCLDSSSILARFYKIRETLPRRVHASKRFRLTISSVECRERKGEYCDEGTLELNEISSSEIAFRPIAPSFARLPEELGFNWAEGSDKEGSVYPIITTDVRVIVRCPFFFFFFAFLRLLLENAFDGTREREREREKEGGKMKKRKKATKISETKEREEHEKWRWKS